MTLSKLEYDAIIAAETKRIEGDINLGLRSKPISKEVSYRYRFR